MRARKRTVDFSAVEDDLETYATTVYGSREGVAHVALIDRRDPNTRSTIRTRRYRWPAQRDEWLAAVRFDDGVHDPTVCPYLMTGDRRTDEAAVERRIIHADIDGPVQKRRVDGLSAMVVASGTADHRHVYVTLAESVSAAEHRALCRLLAWYVAANPADADPKITASDLLMPPGAMNHKPAAGRRAELLARPRFRWSVAKLIKKLAAGRLADAGDHTGDRSEAAWAMIRETKRAGLGEDVAALLVDRHPVVAGHYKDRRHLLRDVRSVYSEEKSGDIEPPKPTPPTADLLMGLRTGDHLSAQRFAPVQWAIPDLVPEGSGMLIGAPKRGKSWITLDLALAVVNGGVALGSLAVGPSRPVLLLALEDGERRLQGRAAVLGQRLPRALSYATTLPEGEDVGRAMVEAWLSRNSDARPMVVIDTLAAVSGPSKGRESLYERDYRRLSAYRDLTNLHPGSTVLIVHHTRKPPTGGEADWMDATSGTNGLNGAVDFTIGLDAKRGDTEGWLRSTGRDTPDYEVALTRGVGEGPWRLDGGSFDAASEAAKLRHQTDKLGDRSADILIMVSERGQVSADDVSARLGVEPNAARSMLSRLVQSGRLRRSGRGVYVSIVQA